MGVVRAQYITQRIQEFFGDLEEGKGAAVVAGGAVGTALLLKAIHNASKSGKGDVGDVVNKLQPHKQALQDLLNQN